MPGRSSATEEPARSGPPLSLLGATGGTSQDDKATDPTTGSWLVLPATTTIAEGVHQQEKYSLLVCIFSARGRRSLEPHAWVEDLLKDFFQSILGINLSVHHWLFYFLLNHSTQTWSATLGDAPIQIALPNL